MFSQLYKRLYIKYFPTFKVPLRWNFNESNLLYKRITKCITITNYNLPLLGTHTSCSRHGECSQEHSRTIVLVSKSTLLMLHSLPLTLTSHTFKLIYIYTNPYFHRTRTYFYVFFWHSRIFLDAANTKVLSPAVPRSEWMFSCSCERCSDRRIYRCRRN